MAPHHRAEWIEVSDATTSRLVDPGRLRRLVRTLRDPASQSPQVLLCMGGNVKQRAVHSLFPDIHADERRPSPGFANIHLEASQTRLAHPTLLVDCTYDAPLPIRPRGGECDETEFFYTTWRETEERTKELAWTRLIFPFVDVITLFADDLGGLDVVYTLLERWVCGDAATGLPWKARPSVCIVASPPRTRHSRLQHQNFNARLRAIKVGRHFSSLRLVCLPDVASTTAWPSSCSLYLQRVLRRNELARALRRRQSERVLFTAHHFAAFFTLAVAHVAQSIREPFDFVLASRIHRPLPACYPQQISTFVRLAVENHISFDDVVSTIASSVILDAFPSGTHRKTRFPTSMRSHVAHRLHRFLPARSVRGGLFDEDPSILRERLRVGRVVRALIGMGD